MMKIKVGDEVLVIAGKDKGKNGKVIKTLRNDNKVVVEGINIVKKHVKPRMVMIKVEYLISKLLFMYQMLRK